MATKEADQCTAGLNFVTARPRRDLLTDYLWILDQLYRPAAYFDRVRRVGRVLHRPTGGGTFSLKSLARDVAQLGWILGLMSYRQPKSTFYFFKTVIDCARHNPGAIESVVIMMAMYLHLGPFAREVATQIAEQITQLDAGEWVAPPLVPPEPALTMPQLTLGAAQ